MNIRTLASIWVMCLFCNKTQAQSPVFDWVQLADRVNISAIATDDSGYLYTTGTFIGTVHFDPSTTADSFTDKGRGDAFITKRAPDGHLVWVRCVGGTNYDQGSGIAIDNTGGVYVAGFFGDTVDFGTGAAAMQLNCFTLNSFVLKLDASGNTIWVKQLNGFAENHAISLCISNNNELIVTGDFQSNADFDPGLGTDSLFTYIKEQYIWKLDTAGNLVWAKQIASTFSATSIYSAATDRSGNIVLVGRLADTADLDPGPGVHSFIGTSTSTFILKLNPSGNYVWAYKMDSVDIYLNNGSIFSDGANNYYLGGGVANGANLGVGGSVHRVAVTATTNRFVLKLDSNAHLLWVQQMATLTAIAVDTTGSVYTCGNSLHKLGTNGGLVWTSDSSLSTRIVVGSSGDLYISGYIYRTFDFDPGPGVYTLPGSGKLFFEKMHQLALSVSNPNRLPGAIFNVYPNPNNGDFNISGGDNECYMVTNVLGQVVRQINVPAGQLGAVKVSGLSGGVYTITNIGGKAQTVIVTP